MNGVSDIMKINGFKKEGFKYTRDDGIEYNFGKKSYIVFGNGDVCDVKNSYEAIGYMAQKNIINRLF